MAGVLHPAVDEWIGGKSVVVQVGDLLDRGDTELELLCLMRKVQTKAKAAGGALYNLVGNHETLNADGRDRYATVEAMQAYTRWNNVCRFKRFLPGPISDSFSCSLWTEPLKCKDTDAHCKAIEVGKGSSRDIMARDRRMALRAGGPIAKEVFSKCPTVLIAGDTVLVHGGLVKKHVEHSSTQACLHSLNSINKQVSDFLAGRDKGKLPHHAFTSEGVLWNRIFSNPRQQELDHSRATLLAQTLSSLPGGAPLHRGAVKRMVVGHSIQPGKISSSADGQIWRVDIGMSKRIHNRRVQVLEILKGGRVTVLSEEPHLAATLWDKMWRLPWRPAY